ncbi:diguanylate cyclase [Exiguobacterium sp. SH5S13]|uniref:GGDEF domain-containing protein n=1 Tax=Exiguobacterium sp. SH5S13 TaxID=2510959 RepID=UPI00103DD5DD|nr:diguanylate cyclase [Exiguobacterium sp. SH5S13]TCI52089.1 diguanylate cyclase [Exiguobacterium sp. SH5S13]
MPIISLFVNACVAFTGFYLISKVFHSQLFFSSRSRGVLIGMLAGMLGLFLMFNGVEVNEDVRVDLRHLPLVLLAFYGARLPLFIATGFIASTRFLFGFTDQAVVAFIATWFVSLGMIWIHRRLSERLFFQSMLLNVWALFVISIAVLINLGWSMSYITLIATIWTVGLLVGLLSSVLTIDLDQAKRRAKDYKQSAERDPLTGLFNRRVWDRYTSELENENRPSNVLALDIDHFKRVNDTYGHANGDLVLQRFAELLLAETRLHDVVARVGGEEFVILMYDLTPEKVEKVAERIRKRIEDEVFVLKDFPPIHITASIGIAHGKSEPVQKMTEAADNALYQAKRSGRNQVILTNVSELSLVTN